MRVCARVLALVCACVRVRVRAFVRSRVYIACVCARVCSLVLLRVCSRVFLCIACARVCMPIRPILRRPRRLEIARAINHALVPLCSRGRIVAPEGLVPLCSFMFEKSSEPFATEASGRTIYLAPTHPSTNQFYALHDQTRIQPTEPSIDRDLRRKTNFFVVDYR